MKKNKLKILFATHGPHLPQRISGAYVSTHEISKELINHGHKVAVFSRLVSGDYIHIYNRIINTITGNSFPKDNFLGYPTYRGWGKGDPSTITHGLTDILKKFQPDVVFAQGGQSLDLAFEAQYAGFPSCAYLHDIEFSELPVDPTSNAHIQYVANSEFTAKRFESVYGLNAVVIPPLVDYSVYRTQAEHEYVLFINPIRKKGLDIVVSLANRRPDINFVFQESWFLTDTNRNLLINMIRDTKNIKLHPPVNNMVDVYRGAKVLIVPSLCEEAWGRVATEAQISGIPVIASNRGGLPESVGNGGIIIPHDAPIENWENALSSLWDNNDIFNNYSKLAISRSQREEITGDYITTQTLQVMYKQISNQKMTNG